ncbi:MAG: tetratricopeptide repeat protein [Acidobacteria bacterium]|nr:tetratricopeptide repeat protein [Acidobacteriota bacterium]
MTPAVDAELWRVVKRMLEKERDRRYPSMREVERELCAVLRGDAATRSVSPGVAERSVAVMTFTNITGSPEDEWLATAISETVTADLKALGGVAVFGNERVHEVLRRLRSGRSGIDERLAIDVGREMGARWIVSGGFQRVGDQLRITARFLEVSSGEVLRTVKIDGATADLFALQDRIARELAQGLPALASPGAPAAATPEETTVLPAYEAFTKGVYNRRVAGRDSLERAILFFERAVALDPLYLRAQVALAMAYDDKGQDLSAPEPVEKAVAIFQKVLVRDPGRSEAWRGYASALGYLGRSAEALVAVQRALALRPEDARVHASYARILFLGYARFADAAAELEVALRINPQAGWAALQLVHCYTLLNDLAKAEEVARRAVALQRQLVSGKEGFLIVGSHTRLGHVLTLQGRFEAAEEEYQEELLFLTRVDHVLRERARIELDTRLGEVLLKTGREEEARLHFRRAVTSFEERLAMGADEPFTRYYVALALTHLGEKARAVEFLEEAARMRRLFTVARAALEAGFAGLRGDPGFEALLAS